MGKETRPVELRNFQKPERLQYMLDHSPEVQQEVVRFVLSFKAICAKHGEQESVDSLNFLQDFFINKYSDFLKPQPLYNQHREIIHYEPNQRLTEVLEGRSNINVPEDLLEKNPTIKQAGLELLLGFWKLYEHDISEEAVSKVLVHLKKIIIQYLEMYPESIESDREGFEELKKEVLGKILVNEEEYKHATR